MGDVEWMVNAAVNVLLGPVPVLIVLVVAAQLLREIR